MVTTIRNLMSDSENWFQITNESDYHFPGVFATPHPKRLGYCADISTLPQYDCHNPHFLFSDIQLGKGKARNPQKVSMVVDGKEETLWYRIVPCGGVKLCPAAGCTHVVATREVRSCSHHPSESSLDRTNQVENVQWSLCTYGLLMKLITGDGLRALQGESQLSAKTSTITPSIPVPRFLPRWTQTSAVQLLQTQI